MFFVFSLPRSQEFKASYPAGFDLQFVSFYYFYYFLPSMLLYTDYIFIATAWKESKYRVISGPCFSVFGLNAERNGASLCIESEYRKMQTRNNSIFGHFSHSEYCTLFLLKECFSLSLPLHPQKRYLTLAYELLRKIHR